MPDLEKEFRALAAEHLALSIIVGRVLSRLARDPSLRRAIVESFDQAADVAQGVALTELGEPTDPQQAVEALRIIEETRAMVLGNEGKPDDSI
jgi:hypothetical protein